jgi:hypothetical protein
MNYDGTCAITHEVNDTCIFIEGFSQKGYDHFERLRPGREGNIKMDFKEVGCEGVDWIQLAQDNDQWRDLVTIINIRLKKRRGIS